MNWNKCERKQPWSYLRYCFGIFLWVQWNTMRTLRQDSKSQSRDLTLGPPGHKAEVLPARLQLLVINAVVRTKEILVSCQRWSTSERVICDPHLGKLRGREHIATSYTRCKWDASSLLLRHATFVSVSLSERLSREISESARRLQWLTPVSLRTAWLWVRQVSSPM
jgi:hypothetical protein